jgi:hypothetical protein
MSTSYQVVQWSLHKKVYDGVAAGFLFLYLVTFLAAGSLVYTGDEAISPPILAMRATGSCALLLLHIVLAIGPAARLQPRLLPVLYNRRHLGVMTFCVASTHALLAVGFYHGFGSKNPLISLLGINANFGSIRAFPFELLGVTAWCVLLVLASTSHDFWLKALTPRVWKTIHMSVYGAYALLVCHVALGALQTSRSPATAGLLILGVIALSALHGLAAVRAGRIDRGTPLTPPNDWLDAGPAAEIPVSRARVVCAPGGERIAVFRDGNRISAVTNVCAHQGGPLGEGKILDGCITCPWHGWQYRAEDGCSPPPFKEKITTYQVRIEAGRVKVDPRGCVPGTALPPAIIGEESDE